VIKGGDMKLYAHYDVLGNIHGFFSVEAIEGAGVLIYPRPGLLVGEVETEGLGLKYDDSDGERLRELAKTYVIADVFPRHALSKRTESQ
jgi:hypothetical protein